MNTTDNSQPQALTPGEAQRQAFENWSINGQCSSFDLIRHPTGEYVTPEAHCAWMGWQAAISTHLAQIKGPSDGEIKNITEAYLTRGQRPKEIKDLYATHHAAALAARDAEIAAHRHSRDEMLKQLATLTRERDEAREKSVLLKAIGETFSEEVDTLRQQLAQAAGYDSLADMEADTGHHAPSPAAVEEFTVCVGCNQDSCFLSKQCHGQWDGMS